MTTKHLFLDLEDTIVTPIVNGWDDFNLINLQKIRKFMKEHDFANVNIFSFAIHDTHNLALFNKFTRPAIQEALGVGLGIVPIVANTRMEPSIIAACAQSRGLHPTRVSFSDLAEFWGKGPAFEDFIGSSQWGRAGEVFLLDDAVRDKDFGWPTKNIVGHILNIDDMSH
jgi:hypothetical protein